jgi:8-oxo-dGTP diphosphatase
MKEFIVVAGIILQEGKILCMQRGHSKYEYVSCKYEFPGGKVEPQESQLDALKRELSEEMDIEAEILDSAPYLSVKHEYPDFIIHLHSYRCRIRSFSFTLKDHIGYQLLAIPDLLSLDWAPADIPIVEKLMAESP